MSNGIKLEQSCFKIRYGWRLLRELASLRTNQSAYLFRRTPYKKGLKKHSIKATPLSQSF